MVMEGQFSTLCVPAQIDKSFINMIMTALNLSSSGTTGQTMALVVVRALIIVLYGSCLCNSKKLRSTNNWNAKDAK